MSEGVSVWLSSFDQIARCIRRPSPVNGRRLLLGSLPVP